MPEDYVPPRFRPAEECSLFNASAAEAMFDRALQTLQTSGASAVWRPLDIADAARLLPGYEMVSLVGRGGMGAVYQARQESLARTVALKLLPLEVSADRAFVERFIREARTLARLNHPNIVAVHDFGQTMEGHFYFVMEFVEGTNLAELIHGPGLTPGRLLEIIARVCDALHYAHLQGVIHRDIKPANILISTAGQVKVADFGLARWSAADPEASGTTAAGLAMGTPDYMAPEQLKGAPVDHRADIYALGVMFYEMLCREVPRGAFQPPSKMRHVDPRLDRIVLKAMSPRPEDRYQSTAEMLAAVERLLPKTRGFAATPDGRGYSPAQKRIARNIVIGTTLAALVVGATFWQKREQQRPPTSLATSTNPEAVTFASATREHPYVNSLGMEFVPVPIVADGASGSPRVLFSTWETRRRDYDAFAAETKRPWAQPISEAGPQPLHPANFVTWYDAQDFCRWLTERERGLGKISDDECYRLPSDREWSGAAGIADREDPARLPSEISNGIPNVFPWGPAWPPPKDAGNLEGEECQGRVPENYRILAGYRDEFVGAAPVGSFPANALGLFDMAGNVREWCEDEWRDPTRPTTDRRVTRSSAYTTAIPEALLSSNRQTESAQNRAPTLGFRVVLTKGPLPELRSPPPVAARPSIPRSPTLPTAALRRDGTWVDWFAEQARAGLATPNFEKQGARWKSKWGLHFPAFAGSVRDVAVRFTMQPQERFDLPNVMLRKITRPDAPLAAGMMGGMVPTGQALISKYTEGRSQQLSGTTVPDFDQTKEFTLEFEARDARLRLAINGQEMVTAEDFAPIAGECEVFVPVGCLISRLEYRLPVAGP